MIVDYKTGELTTAGNRLVGKIDAWLLEHPGFYPPSRIARGIKATSVETSQVLDWLDRRGLWVVGSGNGAWRRYATRPIGK